MHICLCKPYDLKRRYSLRYKVKIQTEPCLELLDLEECDTAAVAVASQRRSNTRPK